MVVVCRETRLLLAIKLDVVSLYLLEQLGVGAGVELVLVPLGPQHGERVGVDMALLALGGHRQGRPAGVEAGGSRPSGGRRPGRGHPRGGGAGGQAAGGGGLGGTLTTHSENISRIGFHHVLECCCVYDVKCQKNVKYI